MKLKLKEIIFFTAATAAFTLGAELYSQHQKKQNIAEKMKELPRCYSEDNSFFPPELSDQKKNDYYELPKREFDKIGLLKANLSNNNSIIFNKPHHPAPRGGISRRPHVNLSYNFKAISELEPLPIEKLCAQGFTLSAKGGSVHTPEHLIEVNCFNDEQPKGFEYSFRIEAAAEKIFPQRVILSSNGFSYNHCPSNLEEEKLKSNESTSNIVAIEYSNHGRKLAENMHKAEFTSMINSFISEAATKGKERLVELKIEAEKKQNIAQSWM